MSSELLARLTAYAPLTTASTRDGATVYVVACNAELREKLASGLVKNGFAVSAFPDTMSFYRALIAARCDTAIIDLSNGHERGLSVVSHLRRSLTIGIVALSASAAIESRLQCFDSGADACLVAPVDIRELTAQLRVLHRRMGGVEAVGTSSARKGWTLEEDGWLLRDGLGNELSLTTAERGFLLRLSLAPGEPVSRAELLSNLGGDPQLADPHRIDVLVNRLRRKAALARMDLPLHSVRGKGYTLTSDCVSSARSVLLSRDLDHGTSSPHSITSRPGTSATASRPARQSASERSGPAIAPYWRG